VSNVNELRDFKVSMQPSTHKVGILYLIYSDKLMIRPL